MTSRLRRAVRAVTATRTRRRWAVSTLTVAVVIAVLVMILVVGLADALYHPKLTPPTPAADEFASADPSVADSDGREGVGAAGTIPGAALAAGARVNSLTLPLRGAAPTIEVVPGVWCEDWRDRLPSDSAPAGWTRLTETDWLVVHNTGTNANTTATAQAVANYHVGSLGWEHTGYHFHVNRDGSCQYALDVKYEGYHALTWNRRAIAIVLESTSAPVGRQLSIYHALVAGLAREKQIPAARVIGHRDTSQWDATHGSTPWGEVILTKNDHVDPCAGGARCDWDVDKFDLTPFLVGGPPPAPPVVIVAPPAGLPAPPSRAIWATGVGEATYYEPTGQNTANGEPYDGQRLTAAAWLVAPIRANDCGSGQIPHSGGCPAYLWGTWLEVCWGDVCTPVKVNDTGGGVKPNQLDLSPRAFGVLAPLAKGRLAVTWTVWGRDGLQADGQLWAFYPCAASPQDGGWVNGDNLVRYRKPPEGGTGNERYGCPIEFQARSDDGVVWRQRFSKGELWWSAARKSWWVAN